MSTLQPDKFKSECSFSPRLSEQRVEAMNVIHFTSAADPLSDFGATGARFVPLAVGQGSSHALPSFELTAASQRPRGNQSSPISPCNLNIFYVDFCADQEQISALYKGVRGPLGFAHNKRATGTLRCFTTKPDTRKFLAVTGTRAQPWRLV